MDRSLEQASPQHSRLRRIVSTAPLVVGVYAMSSIALGYGFGNLAFDAVALSSTAGGFMVGAKGIKALTSQLDQQLG